MSFKFEKLEVWNLSLEYIDLIYEIANKLPRSEEFKVADCSRGDFGRTKYYGRLDGTDG